MMESIRGCSNMPAFHVSVQVMDEFDDLVSCRRVRQLAEGALEAISAGDQAGASVVIAGDDDVRELNRRHRGLDEYTDVLAFSFRHEGPYYGEDEARERVEVSEFVMPPGQEENLGEVVISYPQTQRQAALSGHSVERELALLVVHGLMHLLGYDDVAPGRRVEMEATQSRVLAQVWRDG